MKKAFLFLSIFFTATFINAQESGETGAVESEGYKDLEYDESYGGILPFEWGSTIPDIEKSENHPNGFDGLPSSCYEAAAPNNCYDPSTVKSTSSKGKTSTSTSNGIPIIHLSIETGKNASIILNEGEGEYVKKLPPYDDLRLLRIQKYDLVRYTLYNLYENEEKLLNAIKSYGIDFSEGNKETTDFTINVKKKTDKKKEISFKYKKGNEIESVFGLFAKNGAKGKDDSKPIWTEFLRIHIIPYDPKIKEFVYIQLDGVDNIGNEIDPELSENGITPQKVLTAFNKVYNEAAVKAKITIGKDGDKDFVIDENTTIDNEFQKKFKEKKFRLDEIKTITINMTNLYDEKSIKEKNFTDAAINYLAKYGDVTDVKSKYRNIVFVINAVKKKWELKSCINPGVDDHINLNYCNGFNPDDGRTFRMTRPEKEPSYTNYYVIRPNKECKKDVGDPQKIPLKIKKGIKDDLYYAIKSDGKPFDFLDCDVLHTDNGRPFIPWIITAAGAKSNWQKKHLEDAAEKAGKDLNAIAKSKGKKYDDYVDELLMFGKHLPYGGISITPKPNTNDGEFTVVHEVGHMFGLTDVAGIETDIIKKSEKTYGSTERNLMTWTGESGTRVRYRDTPIACTGGEKIVYMTKLNTETGKSCTKGEKCISFPWDDSREVVPTTITEIEENIINQNENQWECIRDCYRYDLITSTRLKFWMSYSPNLIGNKGKKYPNECNIPNETTIYFDKLKKSTSLIEIKKTYNPPLGLLQAYYTLKELKRVYSIEELKNCINPATGNKCFDIK